MPYLKEIRFPTGYGEKRLCVWQGDVTRYPEPLDLLTVSAFRNDYCPVSGTLIGALDETGVSVQDLSKAPAIDLRDFCGCWLSAELEGAGHDRFRRLACIELSRPGAESTAELLLERIQSFFQMLDLLPVNHISLRTIAMPFLGTGNQRLGRESIIVPLLSESLRYLRRSPETQSLVLVGRSSEKAEYMARALEQSLIAFNESENAAAGIQTKRVFISYSSRDKEVADLLCAALERRGLRVWYAPRDIREGNYAGAIVQAIRDCTHFVPIISEHSMRSEHVLNEIDLAFDHLSDGVSILPLRIDREDLRAEFQYYLKRQHWTDAALPPMERRVNDFADRLLGTAGQ